MNTQQRRLIFVYAAILLVVILATVGAVLAMEVYDNCFRGPGNTLVWEKQDYYEFQDGEIVTWSITLPVCKHPPYMR